MKAPGSHECYHKRIAVLILKAGRPYQGNEENIAKETHDHQSAGIPARGHSNCELGKMSKRSHDLIM